MKNTTVTPESRIENEANTNTETTHDCIYFHSPSLECYRLIFTAQLITTEQVFYIPSFELKVSTPPASNIIIYVLIYKFNNILLNSNIISLNFKRFFIKYITMRYSILKLFLLNYNYVFILLFKF